jgi:hypothetical protein
MPRRDPEERDIEVVMAALRGLLKDKPTERALRRLAKAALGETPEEPRPPGMEQPLRGVEG